MRLILPQHFPRSLPTQIRGAPAIASLAALAVAQHLSLALDAPAAPEWLSSPAALQGHVQPLLDYLFTARPTAVNLSAATRRLASTLQAGVASGKDPRSIAQEIVAEGKAIDDEDVSRNKEMSRRGAEWLLEDVANKAKKPVELQLMTVCNTGSLATSVSTLRFI